MQTGTESFDVVVANLKETTPDSLVAQIHKVFGTIRRLDVDEVIAAYQTLNFIKSNSGGGLALMMQIGTVQDALKLRMRELIDDVTSRDVDQGAMLRGRLNRMLA